MRQFAYNRSIVLHGASLKTISSSWFDADSFQNTLFEQSEPATFLPRHARSWHRVAEQILVIGIHVLHIFVNTICERMPDCRLSKIRIAYCSVAICRTKGRPWRWWWEGAISCMCWFSGLRNAVQQQFCFIIDARVRCEYHGEEGDKRERERRRETACVCWWVGWMNAQLK